MQQESPRVPDGTALGRAGKSEGLLLGSASILPLLLAAGFVWLLPGFTALAETTAIGWAGGLLAFLAGVRRGLSFSEAGGARPAELGSMLWLFALAMATLWLHRGPVALGAAILGFLCLALLDAGAAWRRQAPGYFVWFRPLQSIVAILALAALLAQV